MAEEPVEAHDPNNFEFIRKKRGSISNQYLTTDGKYFYNKPLDFLGRDYLTLYSTNKKIYQTANYLDLMSSSLALLSFEKLGWQTYSLALQNGSFSPFSSGIWALVFGI